MAEFVRVAATSEIPEGDMKAFTVGDSEVLVANVKGEYVAMDNACPHVGAPLSQGFIDDKGVVTCPLHGWQFNTKTGEGIMPPGPKIGCFAIKIEGEDILVESK